MGDQAIAAAVTETVQEAADQAAQEVRDAAAVEDAADRVEAAADHVEAAAAAHHDALVEHHVGLTHDDVRSIIREELAAAVPAAEPITAEHAQDVGEAAAESAVEAIV